MGGNWNRSGLREMDRADRWARQSRPSSAPAWHQKQFDRRVPGRKTRTYVVGHTMFGGPRERDVQAAVQKFARAGWVYVARTEESCLMGLSTYTLLTFQREPRVRRRSRGKSRGCLTTLVLIVAILVIGMLVIGVLG